MFTDYDIIVVGGGHAGCEAAAAAAKLGSSVLLITMNMQTIGQMSCNPAMGGIAKGQIIREIDAMGGLSAEIADETAIQFRMLNKSKGPAMWSPRTQNDRTLFAQAWRLKLEQIINLDFWQDTVSSLLLERQQIRGVCTQSGHEIKAKVVILTNGTFLNGLIHIGEKHFGGGRIGEKPVYGLTEQLIKMGFEQGRMKTGTPPRIDGRSLDYSKMEEQHGDVDPKTFSFMPKRKLKKQRSCFISYTNLAVHDILRTGFNRSPLFSGRVKGVGPRYCPSIEDKIERFATKERHQLFIEPEGWNTVEVYLNGFSTSLPEEIQQKAMRKIPGFENVKMFRPGYAIEYDYFPPFQLKHTLQTAPYRNLFFAGQINGTTGYEEAACQGLMAGINAHQYITKKEMLVLSRNQAYIGVLIDDLINKGVREPYRMFTSRAEFRILLRQDNADLRLSPISFPLGLIGNGRYHKMTEKQDAVNKLKVLFKKTGVSPDHINPYLASMGLSTIQEKTKVFRLLQRPQLNIDILIKQLPQFRSDMSNYSKEILEQAQIQTKYERYIEKEKELVDKMDRLGGLVLPKNINYGQLSGLSSEAKEKLTKYKPATIGHASRIGGISPSDISVLMVHLHR